MEGRFPPVLIIAAGCGSRFGAATRGRPKALIEVGGVSLMSRILSSAREAGFRRFWVVAGYEGEILEKFLAAPGQEGLKIRCLRNEEWKRANGLSVLRARGHIRGPFVLLMCDHLFDSRILQRLLADPLPRGRSRLAVDFHPERVPDLADATKVRVESGRIIDIGKEIRHYNAIDTGIFFCSPSLFNALETARREGKESLSDGIRELARRRRMEAVDIGDLFWQDVDDEAARREAEKRILRTPLSPRRLP